MTSIYLPETNISTKYNKISEHGDQQCIEQYKNKLIERGSRKGKFGKSFLFPYKNKRSVHLDKSFINLYLSSSFTIAFPYVIIMSFVYWFIFFLNQHGYFITPDYYLSTIGLALSLLISSRFGRGEAKNNESISTYNSCLNNISTYYSKLVAKLKLNAVMNEQGKSNCYDEFYLRDLAIGMLYAVYKSFDYENSSSYLSLDRLPITTASQAVLKEGVSQRLVEATLHNKTRYYVKMLQMKGLITVNELAVLENIHAEWEGQIGAIFSRLYVVYPPQTNQLLSFIVYTFLGLTSCTFYDNMGVYQGFIFFVLYVYAIVSLIIIPTYIENPFRYNQFNPMKLTDVKTTVNNYAESMDLLFCDLHVSKSKLTQY